MARARPGPGRGHSGAIPGLELGGIAVTSLPERPPDQPPDQPEAALSAEAKPPLAIPVNAEGHEALFDVFASLPGLRTERMLAELRKAGAHQVVIWERIPSRPTHQRLH